jgi:hypothetical protein
VSEGRFVAVSYFELLQNAWKSVIMGWRITLKYIFMKWDGKAWSGSIWLRIGTGGEVVVNAVMNFEVPQNARNFLIS